jgi:bacteriocin biosynthesis cyclodehydratase domain-containing protein
MIERPGVLHFYDGRRVVSIRTDDTLRAAITSLVQGQTRPGLDNGSVLDHETLAELGAALTALGLLEPDTEPTGSAIAPLDQSANFCAASVDTRTSAQARESLRAATVWVLGSHAATMTSALANCGLRTRSVASVAELRQADAQTDMLVASSGEVGFETINAACLANGMTWLPIADFDGEAARIGPLIIPGQTACHECVITRLSANVSFATLYRDLLDAPPAPAPAALRDWVEAVATMIVVQWLGAQEATLPGTLHTLVPRSREIRVATVLRVPRCAQCGAPDYLPAAAPWEARHDD